MLETNSFLNLFFAANFWLYSLFTAGLFVEFDDWAAGRLDTRCNGETKDGDSLVCGVRETPSVVAVSPSSLSH